MNSCNIQNVVSSKYQRLLEDDIRRLPNLQITRVDFSQGNNDTFSAENQQQTNTPKTSKKKLWHTISTITTFALIALYFAHRNNLFNPIVRQTNKIIDDTRLQEKVNNFVSANYNNTTCTETTAEYLKTFINTKGKPKNLVDKAKQTLADEKMFVDLMEKITKRLSDDTNSERLQKGFTVDVLDRLHNVIPTVLQKIDKKLSYDERCTQVITELTNKTADSQSLLEKTLKKSIISRCENTIESFLKNI